MASSADPDQLASSEFLSISYIKVSDKMHMQTVQGLYPDQTAPEGAV